jgi:hypothetical protein
VFLFIPPWWEKSHCSRNRFAGSMRSARLTGPGTESDPVSTMVKATAASTNGSWAEAVNSEWSPQPRVPHPLRSLQRVGYAKLVIEIRGFHPSQKT